MKYENFKIEDFLANKEFIEWVKKPTLESNIFWQKWIEFYPHKVKTLDQARKILLSIQYSKPNLNEDRAMEVLGNILMEQHSQRHTNYSATNNHRSSMIFLFAKVAAAILILLTSVICYFTYENGSGGEINSPDLITKSNPNGRKSTIILPDSSIVKLNSDSKISYYTDFKERRIIKLSGEAFFSVRKGVVPFQVQTQYLTTIVLGTKFNVKAFAGELRESISLVEGSVKVENKLNTSIGPSILKQGERLEYDEKEHVTYRHEFDPEELAWKDGFIVFNKTGVADFIQVIRRWYGVEVTILGKSNTQWEITGKYKAHSLDLLLESIKFTEGINYRIFDKNVELHIN